ncbi:MAG TPA: hypothetical protein VES91_00070, partial [Burkholderiaceae bacterium]|nr:hypothetical protein [Burkholderiaceae bacterium]
MNPGTVRRRIVALSFSLFVATVALAVCGCSGSGGSGGSDTPPVSLTLNLEFTRNTSPANGSFKAVVWLSNSGGAVVPFSVAPSVASTRGSVSALTLRGDGKQEATITPDAQKTGEYQVTVAGQNLSTSLSALVIEDVASGWGQPMAVEGLVNTLATQDSVVISNDGQYLFLQYYPLTLHCILGGDPNNSFCQTPLGPVIAPQRPNMPGASRVGVNSIQHGCPSINFDPSPFPVPPIALYGFRRQADASFAEPFVLRFAGADDG